MRTNTTKAKIAEGKVVYGPNDSQLALSLGGRVGAIGHER